MPWPACVPTRRPPRSVASPSSRSTPEDRHDVAQSPVPRPQKGARRRKLRKGRGIAAGQGASCGFGMRGQKSRSGRPTRPGFEGGQMPLYRRVPKLKHFTVINPKNYTVINVAKLSELKAGSTVNIDTLVKDGLVTNPKAP